MKTKLIFKESENECARAVRDFCSFVEEMSSFPIEERLRKTSINLARLHAAFLDLPRQKFSGKPKIIIYNDVFPEISFGKHDSYWEYFNPYDKGSSCKALLCDDLSDIYIYLIDGLIAWDEIGTHSARKWALYVWKSNYHSHSSEHATGALRAINAVLTRLGLYLEVTTFFPLLR